MPSTTAKKSIAKDYMQLQLKHPDGLVALGAPSLQRISKAYIRAQSNSYNSYGTCAAASQDNLNKARLNMAIVWE